MEVIIEIGDESIQRQIKDELEIFLTYVEAIDPPLNIKQIIVPSNFEAKVNECQSASSFKAKRGIENAGIAVVAKIIEIGEGVSIVLSPFIYLSTFDSMIRCFILFHEIAHMLNKRRFPVISTKLFAVNNYMENLYVLFDEYFADRFAFIITEKIFALPTAPWKVYYDNWVSGYLEPTFDPHYYELIQAEIEKFRQHGDVDRYWNSIIEFVQVIAISTVHGFAGLHQHADQDSIYQLPTSKFINEKTLTLLNYLKVKFEKAESDLSDGYDLMVGYFTNFGIKFEDRSSGGYIYVLDI